MGRKADTHIRVTEETWQELNSRKGPGDAFEDVIRELLDAADGNSGDDEDTKKLIDISDIVIYQTEAESDDSGVDSSSAELDDMPDEGDKITHPTMGLVEVVEYEDHQMLVEEVDGVTSDSDTIVIGGDVDDIKHPLER